MTQLVAHRTAVEQAVIEQALFPAMLSLALETLTRGGWTIRQDVPTILGRSVRKCFKSLDPIAAAVLATKLADEAKSILDAANESDVPTLWRAVAHMSLRVASRGHAIDADALLVCTAIEYEWAEDNEARTLQTLDLLASRMENEARRRGWWLSVLAAPVDGGHTPSKGIDEIKLRRL